MFSNRRSQVTMNDPAVFARHMQQGAAHHVAGRLEQALVAFESALALQPHNTNAANACATMLTALGQPAEAYRILLSVRERLLLHPDGATNLAIAAEACGHADDARQAYARALELNPNHLRALNNTALDLAHAGDWAEAIRRLEHCVSLAPGSLPAWLNLADTLVGARQFAQAVTLLAEVQSRFPGNTSVSVRHMVTLAFDGQIEQAQSAMDSLGPKNYELLKDFLAQANKAASRSVRKLPDVKPDAYELFCQQAFEAMQQCDWRDHDRLTAVIREMLARAVRTGKGRDGRDTQFYGLTLPLLEDEMAQLRVLSIDAIGKALATQVAPFVARRSKNRDDRIHVGLAAQSLRDPRFANGLEQQLRLHDHRRFAIHVYSPTPEPDFSLNARLSDFGAAAVEIAHMTDDEAVGRMRIDELDIFVDMAFDSPWCRPEIPERRVAPIQIRQTTWHRHHPPRPCEYNMSDTFVHPAGIDMEKYGAVVRLPHTCWLAANNDGPDEAPASRAEVGLPEDGLVLCALLPAMMIEPLTFGLWMKMLDALPHAVLWLPAYPAAARANLAREARARGVDAARLVYLPLCTRARMLGYVRLADLFVDAVRFNANHGLSDALRMGVPAVTCAGESMASRLGGSIVLAAGLDDCVAGTPAALVDRVVGLGQDRGALARLRAQLANQLATAPLFDRQARVREWETAWAMMVDRHRTGVPPQAFDVPACPPTVIRPAAEGGL